MERKRSTAARLSRGPITTGAVVGVAAGVWAGRAVHQFANKDRPTTMIDWGHARRIATTMNRTETISSSERAELNADYQRLVDRCIPIVSAYTGTSLPQDDERTFAFDRVDWINANLAGFERMFAPIEALNEQKRRKNVISRAWQGASQSLMSYEVGLLLGYMARRVLGQYDLALLGREQISELGKLYYVEPNIRGIEKKLGLPKEDFRMWLALHETTHAFEFEAHPWLRVHFNGLLGRYMQLLQQDGETLRQGWRGLKAIGARITNRQPDSPQPESWLEAVMDDEQRALFLEMQAMMSVIEGYSNHVMNAVGRDLLPTYDEISRKFEERNAHRSQADELFGRLTGMNVKLEQYRQGEEFIDAVVEARDHAFAHQVWDKPENLPTLQELRNPAAWIARMEQRQPAAS